MENWALSPSCRRVEVLEASLKEAQYRFKEMRLENLTLKKECVKFLEDNFFVYKILIKMLCTK